MPRIKIRVIIQTSFIQHIFKREFISKRQSTAPSAVLIVAEEAAVRVPGDILEFDGVEEGIPLLLVLVFPRLLAHFWMHNLVLFLNRPFAELRVVVVRFFFVVFRPREREVDRFLRVAAREHRVPVLEYLSEEEVDFVVQTFQSPGFLDPEDPRDGEGFVARIV